jgi:hypothetical protein
MKHSVKAISLGIAFSLTTALVPQASGQTPPASTLTQQQTQS